MSSWLQVVVALVGGLAIGMVASRVVHGVVGSPKRPEPLQQAAKPLSGLALSVGIAGGLIVALGIVQPESLDKLTEDAISFIPKLMTAAIIIIIANVLSGFATAALGQTMGRMPLQTQQQVATIVKATIVTLASLLAATQLGVNTDVINLGVAAVFFGIAASLTLLIGLGGNAVAREMAAGRAIKRLVNEGDTITVGDTQGVVVAVHPTAIELSRPDGQTVLIPSSQLVDKPVAIDRVENPADAAGH